VSLLPLFSRSQLLLDEPTNHLSIGAVLWLARELGEGASWKERTVVIVSHDRFFVDAVCSDILHISGVAQRLTQSHGNYSGWARRRSEQQQAYAKQSALRNAEVAKLRWAEDTGGIGRGVAPYAPDVMPCTCPSRFRLGLTLRATASTGSTLGTGSSTAGRWGS